MTERGGGCITASGSRIIATACLGLLRVFPPAPSDANSPAMAMHTTPTRIHHECIIGSPAT